MIVRDMFNKNIERALTVYVIPMPASLSSAMILTMMLVTDEIDSVEDNYKDD